MARKRRSAPTTPEANDEPLKPGDVEVVVNGQAFLLPQHWPISYRRLFIRELIAGRKFKWLTDTSIRVLSPTPMTMTGAELDQMIEGSVVWPAHVPFLERILAEANK